MINLDALKDGDSSFGLFYPKHYTLAGFANLELARKAADALIGHGNPSEDVLVVSGEELIEKITRMDNEAGWLDRMRMKISEFIGTETYFIDQDVTLAKQGGAFVLVYTPEEADGIKVKSVLIATGAEYARRYLNMAIERLIEPSEEIHRNVELKD